MILTMQCVYIRTYVAELCVCVCVCVCQLHYYCVTHNLPPGYVYIRNLLCVGVTCSKDR